MFVCVLTFHLFHLISQKTNYFQLQYSNKLFTFQTLKHIAQYMVTHITTLYI
nr:MAG TPA: hypothetical protein [Caudoviricetes sp.]